MSENRKQKPKNRVVAAFIALFGGFMGIHRFYLGQIGLGFLYFILMILVFVTPILAVIDFIALMMMSDERFDEKYNKSAFPGGDQARMNVPTGQRGTHRNPGNYKLNDMKQKGIEYFRQFDIEDAIEVFEEALEEDNEDISLHFNLACSYSIFENKELAYAHLQKAVELGFSDFGKIMEHEALAYLRIQDDWEEFRSAGFTTKQTFLGEGEQSGLLDELKRLDEMKEKGILTQEEFTLRKKEILKQKPESE